jgi:hypothetical protein
MGYLEEVAKCQKTEKQGDFSADFLEDQQIDGCKFWDEVEIGKETVVPDEFEVEAEDMMAYAEGVPHDNPVFYEEGYARKCSYDGLVARIKVYGVILRVNSALLDNVGMGVMILTRSHSMLTLPPGPCITAQVCPICLVPAVLKKSVSMVLRAPSLRSQL